MAAINFPTATSNGQTFTADTGVIYTYIGTPPNGFWSGTFGTTGLATLDARFVALNDGNSIQTMQTQGLKFNNGTADTILLDGVNGKIGIGGTPASEQLLIRQSAVTSAPSRAAALYLENNANCEIQFVGNSSNDCQLRFGTSSNSFKGALEYELDNNNLKFYTNGSERFKVDSSGNTIFNGTIRRSGSSGKYTDLVVDSAGSYIDASHFLQFRTNGASSLVNALRIDTSGNVGIGTTSPTGKLAVSDGTVTGEINPFSASSTCFIGTRSNHPVSFQINASEKMRLDASGNLGIGDTLTDSFKLKVRNSAGEIARFTDGFAQTLDIRTTTGGVQFRNANNGFISFSGMSGASTVERMRINSSGNVGIGENSPDQLLHLKSTGFPTLRVEDADNSTYFDITNSDGDIIFKADEGEGFSGSAIRFNVDATERMRIDAGGNVGIGGSPVGSATAYNNGVLHVRQPTTSRGSQLRLTNTHTGHGAGDGSFIAAWIDSGLYITNQEPAAIHFSTGGFERMRIDNSGRLLLGTVTEGGVNADDITIATAGNTGITIRSGTSNNGNIYFSDATSGDGEFAGYFQYRHGDNALVFGANSDERMRIDGSGNVGIGESSPDTTLHIDSNGATTTLKISSNTESSVEFDDKGGSAKRYKIGTNISSNDGQLEFKDMTANAERMRIDSSGTLLHGKTSNNINHSGTQIERNGSGGTVAVTQSGNGVNSLILNNRYGSGTQYPLSFRYSGTEVGFVGITSSATSYNTSSDYRLKENVVDLDGAIPRLKTLPVHRFNFIADSETTVDGFLAHEAQLVVPEAVTGTHNEVDGDGNPVMQAIDQSKLVPLLTAALQEAIGRIETLETEVAALKAG